MLTLLPQVLDLSFADESQPKGQVIFLDEFRMAILPDKSAFTELDVFNTLIRQGRPGNLCRLGVPQQLYSRDAKIHIDHDRPLGTPNSNEPLIADPAQAVIVVEIVMGLDALAFLVVRTQALIEQVCSTRAGPHVPWEEWGADAVITPAPMHNEGPDIFVHGAQVMVVWAHVTFKMDWLEEFYYGVYTLDFSRRCGGAGGSMERAFSEGGWCIKFEPAHSMSSWDSLRSLSDGSLFFLVSRLSQPVGSIAID